MTMHRDSIPGAMPSEVDRLPAGALWWGLLLIGGGALWFVDTTGILDLSPLVAAAFFALAGAGFAYEFGRDAGSWWAAIPAGALLGLGALITYEELTTGPREWGATLLIGGTAAGLIAVYLRSRQRWWALLPGAVLVLVAVIVTAVPLASRGQGIAAIVVGLLAAALVVVALIPIGGRRMLWPLIPAGILGVVAGFLARDAGDALAPLNWVSPVVLVVVGVVLVVRMLGRRT